MRALLLSLVLFTGCCYSPSLLTLVETEVGAQERDRKQWDTLSDGVKKRLQETRLESLKEIRWRLTGEDDADDPR